MVVAVLGFFFLGDSVRNAQLRSGRLFICSSSGSIAGINASNEQHDDKLFLTVFFNTKTWSEMATFGTHGSIWIISASSENCTCYGGIGIEKSEASTTRAS